MVSTRGSPDGGPRSGCPYCRLDLAGAETAVGRLRFGSTCGSCRARGSYPGIHGASRRWPLCGRKRARNCRGEGPAGSVPRGHRRMALGGSRRSAQATAHHEAHLRSASSRVQRSRAVLRHHPQTRPRLVGRAGRLSAGQRAGFSARIPGQNATQIAVVRCPAQLRLGVWVLMHAAARTITRCSAC